MLDIESTSSSLWRLGFDLPNSFALNRKLFANFQAWAAVHPKAKPPAYNSHFEWVSERWSMFRLN
jgi:hypothetical protein